MECTTLRKGKNCPLMSKKGCSYPGGACHPVVEKCQGCSRAEEYSGAWYCASFPDPGMKWKNGNCNMATHIVNTPVEKAQKLNPLKASKRGAK